MKQCLRSPKVREQPQRLPQFWQGVFPAALRGKCELLHEEPHLPLLEG